MEKMVGVAVAVSKKFFLILCFILYLESAAVAKTKFGFITNIVLQRGKSGKQVFNESGDQSLEIYEPMVYFESDLSKSTRLTADFLADVWSSASEAIFDTYTGASRRALGSRVKQTRYAANVGVSHKWKSWEFSPDIGFSQEFDYTSYNFGSVIQKSFAEDNFICSFGYHFFDDRVYDFNVDQRQFDGHKPRRTHTFDFTASQLLSPSDIILVGYSLTLQNGLLSSNINSVNLLGRRVDEVLPSSRNRNALSMGLIHGFSNQLAAHLDYRFYFDDWGILSHTIRPAIYYGFDDDKGIVELAYRFYHQTASDYYQDDFTTPLTYQTSDSDLASFFAHEIGIRTAYSLDANGFLHLKNFNIGGGFFYYRRSNDLFANLIQLTIGGGF